MDFKKQPWHECAVADSVIDTKYFIKPGMRVLDLGCGRGISNVFLARKSGVSVYACDLWESADGKWEQAKSHNLQHLITPFHGDARNLPFAKGFFDVILCVDAYIYFALFHGITGYVAGVCRV